MCFLMAPTYRSWPSEAACVAVVDHHRAAEQGAKPRQHVPEQQLADGRFRQIDLHVLLHEPHAYPRLTVVGHAKAACRHAACRRPATARSASACPAWPLPVCAVGLPATRARRGAALPPVVRPRRRRSARHLQDQALEKRWISEHPLDQVAQSVLELLEEVTFQRQNRIAHRQANGIFAGGFQFSGLLLGLDQNRFCFPLGGRDDVGGLLLRRGDERLGLTDGLAQSLRRAAGR